MAIKAEELDIEIPNSDEFFSDDNFKKLCNNLEKRLHFIPNNCSLEMGTATEEEQKEILANSY